MVEKDEKIYVCVKETDALGPAPVIAFRTEEQAREWMRLQYLAWKDAANYDPEDGDIVWEHFTEDDGYATETWLCYHQWEKIGWQVHKVDLLK